MLDVGLDQGRDLGLYTRAVLAVQLGDKIQVQTCGPETGLQTRFDLASLTKVTGTLMGVLNLLARERLTLETTLVDVFPTLPMVWQAVTIEALLTHQTHLPSSIKFYRAASRTTLFAALAGVPPEPSMPNAYSDLNFMWLGLVVEAISGEPLALDLRRHVFAPLEMAATSFDAYGAVPTRVSGAPDDHNAAYFGVPIGHAGLFSNATDLLRFGQVWLRPDGRALAPIWRDRSLQPHGTRGLGWVLPGDPMSFFDAFGESAFGHTGYTGTSLMVCPAHELVVVLLTDRTRCAIDERFPAFRRQLHTQLAAQLAASHWR